MRRGIHTIRGGWTDECNPTQPRRYSLANGNFEVNMQLIDFQILPIGNRIDSNNHDRLGTQTIFGVVATAEGGAVPFSDTMEPIQYGPENNLRMSDSRIIAWCVLGPYQDVNQVIVDPDHIIPNDVYISFWSVGTTGSLEMVNTNVGFMMKFQQRKSTGNEALLYQAKNVALED